jgi:hydrogenase nickel incorporation protein HypA/HybF
MHEFGITSRIIETVLRIADENGADAVTQVDLVIGKLTFLNHKQVSLAYGILVKGTILDGSCLNIEEVEGAVKLNEACKI